MRVLDDLNNRQQTRVLDLIRQLEPGVRIAFLQAIRDSQGTIDFRRLTQALERGDIAAAVDIVNVDRVDLLRFSEALRTVFIRSGNSLEIRVGRGTEVRFDAGAPQAEQVLASITNRAIAGITNEGADAIRRLITVRLNEGKSPASIVTDLVGSRVGNSRTGGILGLTDGMTETILRADRDLRSGDPDLMRRYLGLKLRDRRFDATIQKAIREGKRLSAEDARRIVEAHEAKALGYRGKVIAQTETARLAGAARHEGWRQAIASGAVRSVTIEWRHNASAEPRLDHVAMSGAQQTFGMPFLFPDGTMMRYPHDENAPARHVIGCRCTAIYTPGK